MLRQFLTRRELSTVEPLNKDTFGTSASLLSLVKSLSSFRGEFLLSVYL